MCKSEDGKISVLTSFGCASAQKLVEIHDRKNTEVDQEIIEKRERERERVREKGRITRRGRERKREGKGERWELSKCLNSD